MASCFKLKPASSASLQAQLELARADARRLPQVPPCRAGLASSRGQHTPQWFGSHACHALVALRVDITLPVPRLLKGHIHAFPTRSPAQVQQYARDLEWQLLQAQQAQQAHLEAAEAAGRRAGAAAAGGLEGGEAGTEDAPDSDHAGESLVTHQGRRGGSLPEESAAAEGASGAAKSAVLAPQRRARGRPRGSGKRQLAEGAARPWTWRTSWRRSESSWHLQSATWRPTTRWGRDH